MPLPMLSVCFSGWMSATHTSRLPLAFLIPRQILESHCQLAQAFLLWSLLCRTGPVDVHLLIWIFQPIRVTFVFVRPSIAVIKLHDRRQLCEEIEFISAHMSPSLSLREVRVGTRGWNGGRDQERALSTVLISWFAQSAFFHNPETPAQGWQQSQWAGPSTSITN